MPKIRLIFFLFVFLLGLILVKLFYLQILTPVSSSNNEYLRIEKIQPQRGRIYDRNLQLIAFNQTLYRLYAEPKKVKNEEKLIEALDKVLKIGEATLEARLDKTKDWVAVTSGVTKEKKEQLARLKIKEIGFEETFQRYYPEASLASHLLGFVGKNESGENIGYFGIEGHYDKDLRGLPGLIKSERDLLGKPILLGNQEKIEADNGRDLVLTIDKSIQGIVKRKLVEGVTRYGAKRGCVIVADPYSMEILGLACLPDFDPEKYFESSQDIFSNRAISSLYEPGSTFKPFVMAAAINEKKVKPDGFYNEKGPLEIGGYEIKTWNSKYEGKISMTRILEKSSNVGMVYIGEKLGKNKLLSYLSNYGFGESTDIDLEGENFASIKSKAQWYPIDYATATFGQGIAVTPIQMIRGFSALVNGGELLRPHVVKQIIYGGGKKEIKKQVDRRVLTERTSEIVKKMLVSAVEKGEYKWIRPKGYRIGGKTGTAQIPIEGHYDPSKTIASFIGFAPADEPKFIALVVLEEPSSSIYGSETAAPLFFEIAKELFVYYNIAPQ